MKKNIKYINRIIIVLLLLLSFFLANYFVKRNIITNYLTQKYGDQGFKINKIMQDYDFGNFESLKIKRDGFIVIVSSTTLKQPFMFIINSNNIKDLSDVNDEFIKQYYIEKVNDYLSKNYKLLFETKINDKALPQKYNGTIPTWNDLLESNVVYDTNIYIDYNYDYHNDFDTRINYLKKLSKDLIQILNNSKSFKLNIYLKRETKNEYNYGTIYINKIEISNNYIIIEDNNVEYAFNFNEL